MATSMKTYQAAIFDLDGTLIDSSQAIVASTLAALDELGWKRISEAQITAHIGYKLEAVFPKRTPEERRHLVDTIGRHYDGICAEQTALYPGVEELILGLSGRGVPLGVVTSKRRGHTETILEALGLRSAFSVVVASDDVANMKPDPEGLRMAAQSLGVAPADCLYVGDTRVDVETARGAGTAIAGVAWGTDGIGTLRYHGIDHEIPNAGALATLF